MASPRKNAAAVELGRRGACPGAQGLRDEGREAGQKSCSGLAELRGESPHPARSAASSCRLDVRHGGTASARLRRAPGAIEASPERSTVVTLRQFPTPLKSKKARESLLPEAHPRSEDVRPRGVRRRNHRDVFLPSWVPDSGLSCFCAVSAYCVIRYQMLMVVVVAVTESTLPASLKDRKPLTLKIGSS